MKNTATVFTNNQVGTQDAFTFRSELLVVVLI